MADQYPKGARCPKCARLFDFTTPSTETGGTAYICRACRFAWNAPTDSDRFKAKRDTSKRKHK